MLQVNLYIGANNRTGERNSERIAELIANVEKGFTMIESTGYWLGKAEKSTVVTIFSERNRFFWIEYGRQLATFLFQDCIVCQTITESGEQEIDFCVNHSPDSE